jgi:hypothetical protein
MRNPCTLKGAAVKRELKVLLRHVRLQRDPFWSLKLTNMNLLDLIAINRLPLA